MSKYDSHLKCSFCGKSQEQVRKLIAGPGVYICDECVDLCNEILDEELLDTNGAAAQPAPRAEPPQKRRTQSSSISFNQIPKPREIKNYLVNAFLLSLKSLGSMNSIVSKSTQMLNAIQLLKTSLFVCIHNLI